MLDFLKKIFGNTRETKETIRQAENKRKEIKKTVTEIITTLNGEDRWFLKVCDKKDPKEYECPPEYIENTDKEKANG